MVTCSYRVLFALLAETGMRIGEAAGLHAEDVDTENCRITVQRAVWNGKEQSSKTANGLRVIDIRPDLAQMMRTHSRASQRAACSHPAMVPPSAVTTSCNVCCILFSQSWESRRQGFMRFGVRG